MALKQVIPGFTPALGVTRQSPVTVPRLRQPKTVEFRAGGNMAYVLEEVLEAKVVNLEAAPAAGKSTVFPSFMAKATGKLVVHLCHSEYLAADQAKYVAQAFGIATKFIETPEEEFPVSGIVYMSSACLFAKWVESGGPSMPECIVFQDESHEADGYVHMARTLLPTLGAVVAYISATATSAPAGFRQMESEGRLEKREYPAESNQVAWDIYDTSKPWCADNISEHVLIFEDDKRRANALMADYAQAGFSVFRLSSGMGIKAFKVAMANLRTPSAPLTVLIADSTFRSGFTFPVGLIIDSGRVLNVQVIERRPVAVWRPAYVLERHQAACRGGRMKGQATVYYSPDDDPPQRICDLEASEAELAALGFRLLGYQVPRNLVNAKMASGGVPRNLCSVLREKTPLALVQEDQLVGLEQFFTPQGRRSPFLREDVQENLVPMDFSDTKVSADIARKHNQGRYSVPMDVVQPEPLRPHKKADSVVSDWSGTDDAADVVQDLMAANDAIETLEVGKYYYLLGLTTDVVWHSAFPDGADSVIKVLSQDKSESLHLGYDANTRSVAATNLMIRRNIRTCELRVLNQVLKSARQKGVSKDRGALREWATRMAERMSVVVNELRLIDNLLTRLCYGFLGVAETTCESEEQQALEDAFSVFDGLPDANIGPSPQFKTAVREGLFAEGLASGFSLPKISEEGISVPMPTTGKGMRAVKPVPNKLLLWASGSIPLNGGKKRIRRSSSGSGGS